MLTSKEVLERTGISRATLNNYIATGLLPRPDVQAPGAGDGAAPRIGYFPDGTVERIAEIHRLKREGWSIARIAARFGGAPATPAGTGSSPGLAADRAASPGRTAADAPFRGSPEPRPASPASPATAGAPVQPLPSRQAPAPILTPVAVLVSTLEGAGDLWLQLPAGEYFELVNEIWIELDRIFVRHGGHHGRHPGEGMVCHFLPRHCASYLWSALAAAQQVREAMGQVSSRWRIRKGWDLELCMNTGVDEGHEWLGPLRLAEPIELTVVGDAADHAAQLARSARGGAIWITRNLVGKLTADERRRLAFGVPRLPAGAEQRWLQASFAPLEELAATQHHPAPIPPGLARLAVTELLGLGPGPLASGPSLEGAA